EGVAGDDLGPAHPLGPGEGDPAAVADQVDQAQVDPAPAPDQEGRRGVLAGVDDQGPPADLAHGRVQPLQQVQVAGQAGPVAGGEDGQEHEGHVAVAVHRPLEGQDLVDVQ